MQKNPEETGKKIGGPRSEIDAIDAELVRLLNRRAEIALRVGAAKSESAASLCDPHRERQVLDRLRALNKGPLDDQAVVNVFQRIIDESLQLQQSAYRQQRAIDPPYAARVPVDGARVAILGERGTFSEEAAIGYLGGDCRMVSCPTFEELFGAVSAGRADLVLSPLENSLIGSVHRCVDLLLKSDLRIAAEIVLPVSHYLIGVDTARIDTLQTVESHPAALAQCARFFAAHPDLTRVAADDTAGSVRRAVESGDPTKAAIGSRRAAEIYGGTILRAHIEDNPENYTRFVLLAPDQAAPAAGTKVTLVLRLKHEPGALHAALRPFVRRGIDLVKIESLPIVESPNEFNFYLDVQAPQLEADLTGALDEVQTQAREVRFLGRYSTVRLDDVTGKALDKREL